MPVSLFLAYFEATVNCAASPAVPSWTPDEVLTVPGAQNSWNKAQSLSSTRLHSALPGVIKKTIVFNFLQRRVFPFVSYLTEVMASGFKTSVYVHVLSLCFYAKATHLKRHKLFSLLLWHQKVSPDFDLCWIHIFQRYLQGEELFMASLTLYTNPYMIMYLGSRAMPPVTPGIS